MGVFDKFRDIMRLNDDDYDDYDGEYYDDDYYDEENDYEEKPKRSSLFFGGRRQKKEELDDFQLQESGRSGDVGGRNNVTSLRQASARRNGGSMEVCVIKPTTVDDAREITETLLGGRTVILNLEGLDLETAQRIIDFTAGAAFGLNGNLQKISNYIFLVTPHNVDISGDLQDLLSGSMASQQIHNRY